MDVATGLRDVSLRRVVTSWCQMVLADSQAFTGGDESLEVLDLDGFVERQLFQSFIDRKPLPSSTWKYGNKFRLHRSASQQDAHYTDTHTHTQRGLHAIQIIVPALW